MLIRSAWSLSSVTITFLTIFFLFAQGAGTQESGLIDKETKRSVVDKLAGLLVEHYVFPETGNKLADFIKGELESGAYDLVSLPQLFANRLTRDLRSQCSDNHLVVSFNPGRAKSLLNPDDSEDTPSEEYIRKLRERRRRSNFGFEKIEVLAGNIGYLKFNSFSSTEDAGDIAEGALAFISNSDAVILDLRDNHGGGAGMLTLLSSYFFSEEPVLLGRVQFRNREEPMELKTLAVLKGRRMPDVDLYILTGKSTFSAAEEFAYDLKHIGRAILVGVVTGGGAHMTQARPIDEQFFAMIPFAAAINPVTGTNWEGVGVKPHVEVPEEEALTTAYRMALEKLIQKETEIDFRDELQKVLSELN